MTPPLAKILTLFSIISLAAAYTAQAEPIDFSEVSLLVRAHEPESSIVQEVSQRKLVRPLSAQQESTLRSQGARESLIQALRRPAVVLAQADATAFEARREQQRNQPGARPGHRDSSADETQDNEGLHVFEVSVGHPINLSQWGGPDYELAFNAQTRLDEGCDDAVIINTAGSFTHAATYLGAGRPDDSTTIFDRRNYVSVMHHSFTRGLRVDRRNPVWMKGVPYALYPVYAAGGVSLYYIAGSSDSVKLAVSTSGQY
jgi:hypothetical protein